MTEPVTAKREQVSKKEEDKEDNTSDQEIMVSNDKTIHILKQSLLNAKYLAHILDQLSIPI